MQIFDRIALLKRLFGKNELRRKNDVREDTDSKTADNKIEENSKRNVVFIDEANTWITNEGLLRDEGVLFGLSGVETKEKLAAIDNFYEHLKVSHINRKENLQSQFDTVSKELDTIRTKKGTNKISSELVDKEYEAGPFSLIFRHLFGFILVGIAAIGCFSLIHFYITPLYGLWASLGIFFFGLFAQFAPISSMLSDEDESSLKRVKEVVLETGPAVAATIITTYLIYDQTGKWGLAIVAGLFFLLVFFFNGKLILALAHKTWQELEYRREFKKEQRKVKEKKLAQDALQKSLIEEEQELIDHLAKIKVEISEGKAEVERLEEERKNKVNLFVSEYNLARQFKTTKSN